MPERTAPATSPHLDYLDSARGIAAVMVMVYHFINWKYDQHTSAKIASILFNGSDAVSFFFVLSGFVLSYKYIVLDKPLDIRNFYITRFFRLWPAYFVTIVINCLNWDPTDLSLHRLYDTFILNKNQFWEEAFLFRTHPTYYIPGWTLVFELTISFFIPFYIALAKKSRSIIYWFLFALILTGEVSFHFHFVLGVLISCVFLQVRESAFKETRWYRYRYLIIAFAIVLFSIRHIDRISELGSTYKYIANYLNINFFHYTGIASFVFILAIIISNKAQKVLTQKPLLFLGKISYGIYLMHWLLVTDVFRYWDQVESHFPNTKSAFIVSFCLYVTVTLLLSTILHYAVELPFIRLGKKIAGRLKPSYVIE